MKLGAPTGMGACRDICITIGIVGVKVTIGTEVMGTIPTGLKASSDSSAPGRGPRATDGGCFLGVLCQETEAGVMGKPAAITPWYP